MDRRIAKAIELIHNDTNHRLEVSELARKVNLSSGRFGHLFRAVTSLSPKEYARQWRLLRAKELLDCTFLKVNEIAAQVGFRHVSSFTRDFKSHYGFPPSKSRGRITPRQAATGQDLGP